jgi:prefoldin subunit 5
MEDFGKEYHVFSQMKEAISIISFQTQKVLDVTENNTKKILDLLEKLDNCTPDERDIKEIKSSIGRSDKSVVNYLNEMMPLISNIKIVLGKVPQLTRDYDVMSEHDHRNMADDMSKFVKLLSQGAYSETDLQNIGKWMLYITETHRDIKEVRDHINKLEDFKSRIVWVAGGVISFISIVVFNWDKIKIFIVSLFN